MRLRPRGAHKAWVVEHGGPAQTQRDSKRDWGGAGSGRSYTLELPGLGPVQRLVDISSGRVVAVTERVWTRTQQQQEEERSEEKVGVVESVGLEAVRAGNLEMEAHISRDLAKEVLSLAYTAANAMASMADGDESDWPDGAPPLRSTLFNAGILSSEGGRQ